MKPVTKEEIKEWLRLQAKHESIEPMDYDFGDDIEYTLWASEAVPRLIYTLVHLARSLDTAHKLLLDADALLGVSKSNNTEYEAEWSKDHKGFTQSFDSFNDKHSDEHGGIDYPLASTYLPGEKK